MSEWNSNQYIKFKNQRTQPSVDLISRIADMKPNRILDIGCGPGNSTYALASAFPHSELIGIDSSEDMLKKAKDTYPEICFLNKNVPDELDTLQGNFDLIFSNACIHWIPDQKRLIKSVLNKLCVNGRFAVQIPLIQEAPFYRLLYSLFEEGKWRKLKDIQNFHNLMPEEYYDLFVSLGVRFDMWQTNYYHIMDDHNSIIEWYKGSGLRPYIEALTPKESGELIDALISGLKSQYKEQADKRIIFKMPRLFFIIYN